jgi:Zn-finger nucleic acid-binding protein
MAERTEGGEEADGGAGVTTEKFGGGGGDFSRMAMHAERHLIFVDGDFEAEFSQRFDADLRIVGEEDIAKLADAIGEGGNNQGAIRKTFGAWGRDRQIECAGDRVKREVAHRHQIMVGRCEAASGYFGERDCDILTRMASGQPTCPHCGAAIEQNALECPYCHAALQTEICPKCFGLMFSGSKFCPHCGAVAEEMAPKGTDLSCPRCKTTMSSIKVADTPLDECPHCGGLWISLAAFDHVCSDTAAQTAASGLDLPPPVPQDVRVHYLGCPNCGKLMNRTNYGGGSGIVINVCKGHGVWLDRDEMRQIVEFIRAGGLKKLEEKSEEQAHEQAMEAKSQAMNIDVGGAIEDEQAFQAKMDFDDMAHVLINSLLRHL